MTTLAGAPKRRLLVPLSLQTIPQAPQLPSLPLSLPLGCPSPAGILEGMGAAFSCVVLPKKLSVVLSHRPRHGRL